MDFRFVFLTGLLVFHLAVGLACSSSSPREQLESRQSSARPRAAALGVDFYNDGNYPSRDKRPAASEFFYKHCNLSGRHPYPSASDWDCSEPQ